MVDVLGGFEFEGVAGGVEEEHGCLFARKAFEADIGFDDEFDTFFFQAPFEPVPVFPIQYDSIVRHGYIMTVDGIVVQAFLFDGLWFEMDHELMTKEIEVHPLVRASAFFAAQYITIECPCFDEVIDRYGHVEGSDLFHVFKNTRECPIFLCKF